LNVLGFMVPHYAQSSRPSGSVFRVDHLAAKARMKPLGMLGLGKAEDLVPLVVSVERVAALAEQQLLRLAEQVHRPIVMPHTQVGKLSRSHASDGEAISKFLKCFLPFFEQIKSVA